MRGARAYAHAKRVVHRDLKPANIMVGRFGAVYVMDWGVAKVLGEDGSGSPAHLDGKREARVAWRPTHRRRSTGDGSDSPMLTNDGEIIGTPAYMAHEQALGLVDEVDARADVYSTGAILYRLLSGRAPYDDGVESVTPRIQWQRLLAGPPAPLSEVAPDAPPELVSIAQRAMARDPAQRYGDMTDMAADLRAWLEGRVVRAHETGVVVEVRKWVGRNRASVTVGLLALAATCSLLVRQSLVEAGFRSRADLEQAKGALGGGVALAQVGHFNDAMSVLMPLEHRYPGPETQAALDELFRRHPCLASHSAVSEPNESVTYACFSDDGAWAITRNERSDVDAQQRVRLRLCRVPTLETSPSQPLWVWTSRPVPVGTKPVHVTPGQTVAWPFDDNTLVLDGPGHEPRYLRPGGRIHALLPTGVVGGFAVLLDDRIRLYEADGVEYVDQMFDASLSPSAVVAVLDGAVISYKRNSTDGSVLIVPLPEKSEFNIGLGSPLITHDPGDAARMVMTTQTSITTWRCEAGRVQLIGRQENSLPNRVSVPWLDEEAFDLGVSASQFDGLPLWRTGHVAARYFPDGAGRTTQPYIVAIEARALRIWVASEPRVLDPGRGGLEIARFEPNSQRLWCGGHETLTALTLGVGGTTLAQSDPLLSPIIETTSDGKSASFCGLAFDPGGAVLACARGDTKNPGVSGWVFVIPSDGGEVAKPYESSSEPGWVEFSPDHRQIALAGSGGEVDVWTYDPVTRELKDHFTLPRATERAARLSCVCYLDKQYLLASEAGSQNEFGLLRWDIYDRKAQPVQAVPHESQRAVRCLALSPDGRLLAYGGDDGLVRVMRVDSRSGTPELKFGWQREHRAHVMAVAFTQRDQTLILASADRQGGIRLWEAETGAERGVVRDTSESTNEMILSVQFSSDGGYLAASQRGGRVLLWDMDQPRRCLDGNRDCANQLLHLRAAAH